MHVLPLSSNHKLESINSPGHDEFSSKTRKIALLSSDIVAQSRKVSTRTISQNLLAKLRGVFDDARMRRGLGDFVYAAKSRGER
jgi:hypothetical protein